MHIGIGLAILIGVIWAFAEHGFFSGLLSDDDVKLYYWVTEKLPAEAAQLDRKIQEIDGWIASGQCPACDYDGMCSITSYELGELTRRKQSLVNRLAVVNANRTKYAKYAVKYAPK
jgi:hypothetical protein